MMKPKFQSTQIKIKKKRFFSKINLRRKQYLVFIILKVIIESKYIFVSETLNIK